MVSRASSLPPRDLFRDACSAFLSTKRPFPFHLSVTQGRIEIVSSSKFSKVNQRAEAPCSFDLL